MTSDPLTKDSPGHTVTNQPPPLAGYDVYTADAALRDAVHRGGAGWADNSLGALGRQAGDPRWIEAGTLATTNPPVLHTHDRYGHRIDEVRFHPAWHELMSAGQMAAAGLEVQRAARTLVEQLALALQGALLVRHAPAPVADAFCASRFGGGGWAFGTLADSVGPAGLAAIIERHTPAL